MTAFIFMHSPRLPCGFRQSGFSMRRRLGMWVACLRDFEDNIFMPKGVTYILSGQTRPLAMTDRINSQSRKDIDLALHLLTYSPCVVFLHDSISALVNVCHTENDPTHTDGMQQSRSLQYHNTASLRQNECAAPCLSPFSVAIFSNNESLSCASVFDHIRVIWSTVRSHPSSLSVLH